MLQVITPCNGCASKNTNQGKTVKRNGKGETQSVASSTAAGMVDGPETWLAGGLFGGIKWSANKIAMESVTSELPVLGNKLKYVFGRATGSTHNIERSTGMLRQLESVGIFDNALGNAYLRGHLGQVYNSSKGILQSNGRYLRESLLMGPNGGLKMESIWEGNKLVTIKFLGGR